MQPMELAEGVILDGHYRLRQLLGRGGMGEVWEAEHTRLPKLFAIKFLHGLERAEPELLMRFKREAEIASRLLHPSIVQVTDFNILPDGTAYIAMERLLGEDLRARLQRGPLSLSDAREITRQVASALQLAHESGIVHRDLKPENIFLCREPDGALRAKVLDFGISKLQHAAAASAVSTRDDRVLGTPGYMAPEQALGKNSSIDGRTDLFSLAAIVYEMLTGQGVFRGDTLAELCTKVLYHTPPPLDELSSAVPRSLAVAVSRALSKDPSQRQSEIRAFADAVVGERPQASQLPNVSSAAFGFSATVASDVGATPSIAARALSGGAEASNAEAPDAATRSARPSERSVSEPARPIRRRALAASATITMLLLAAVALVRIREPQPHAASLDRPPSQAVDAKSSTQGSARSVAAPMNDLSAPTTSAAAAQRDAASTVREPGESEAARPRTDVSSPRKSAQPVRTEQTAADVALSPSVRAALDEAERVLQQGDPPGALRLARASLREARTERAYVIMARAYCAQHDVGMLQAMLRNLSPARKKQVQRECQD